MHPFFFKIVTLLCRQNRIDISYFVKIAVLRLSPKTLVDDSTTKEKHTNLHL